MAQWIDRLQTTDLWQAPLLCLLKLNPYIRLPLVSLMADGLVCRSADEKLLPSSFRNFQIPITPLMKLFESLVRLYQCIYVWPVFCDSIVFRLFFQEAFLGSHSFP